MRILGFEISTLENCSILSMGHSHYGQHWQYCFSMPVGQQMRIRSIFQKGVRLGHHYNQIGPTKNKKDVWLFRGGWGKVAPGLRQRVDIELVLACHSHHD